MTVIEEQARVSTGPVHTPAGPVRRRQLPGLLVGPADQPRWVRPSLLALLALSAVVYFWALGSQGWTNDFYAAAVQSGTKSLKAWLFGSLDAGNAITVDKPPAALWLMALSGRIFGFSSFSMLLPEALMGVGSVGLLYATVKRCAGPAAGLIAGTVLTLTPVAAMMFRYDNPDALLVFLLVLAAYCVVRAVESGHTHWLVLCGTAIGFAFLTKMLQGFLVVPGFALMFLVAAPGSFWKRAAKLPAGLAAMVVAAGWYVALVAVWPASARPYIGGSSDNSLLQLALGYNGLGRLSGSEGSFGTMPAHGGMTGHAGMAGHGAPPGGGPMGGGNGIGRLFGSAMGTQISWLLPAALIGLVAVLWITRRAPRTDRVRAAMVLWGGWLLVTGAVFSYMRGIIHPYYTVALAPAIAALVGISVCQLWQRRESWYYRAFLATMLAGTGVWAFVLLDRTPTWLPALRWIVLIASFVVALALAMGPDRLGRKAIVATAALVIGLAAPAAYTIDTVAHTHSGPIPSAGPTSGSSMGFPGGPGQGHGQSASDNTELKTMVANAKDTRWAAAAVGSTTASELELSTGSSIMAIGGFSGSDNSPTLAQFQHDVADHEVKYFLVDNSGPGGMAGGGPGGGNDSAAQITSWVEQHYTGTDVDGTTVYDLST